MRVKSGIFILVFFIIFLTSLHTSLAQIPDELDIPYSNLINKIPITDDGEVDSAGVQLYQSKAEERIAKINGWLENNALWLERVFGMIPAISWEFAMNILIWFIFFSLFILVLPKFNPSVRLPQLIPFLIGAGIFFLTISLKISASITGILMGLPKVWWAKAIIVAVLLVLLSLTFFLQNIGLSISKKRKEDIKWLKNLNKSTKAARKAAKEEIAASSGEPEDEDKITEKEEKEIEEEAEEEAESIASGVGEDEE